MARVKKVFGTNEISHLWAHQTQDEARNAGGNFFFNGKTIYSYGHHFPIATILDEEIAPNVILLNSERYSNTTAKHVHLVKHSIPSNYTVFTVPQVPRHGYSGGVIRHAENIAYYVREIDNKLDKASRARSNKDYLTGEAQALLSELNLYKQTFGVTAPDKYSGMANVIEDAEQIAKNEAVITEAKKKREAEILKAAQKTITKWKRGENVSVSSLLKHALLRIKGEFVETSQGIKIEKSEALKLYKAIRAKIDITGREFKTTYSVFHVYGIENNMLHIGCHYIPVTEVNRIGKQLLAEKI